MSHTLSIPVNVGTTGLTLLASLVNTSAVLHATLRNLACTEIGTSGIYRFSSSSIDDDYRGQVIFHTGTATALSDLTTANTYAVAGLNPEESEYADVKTGTRNAIAPTNLTAAQIATGVWQDTTAGDFTVAFSIGKSVLNGVALGTGLTINAYTGNTPQSGDSFALIGTAGAGLTAIGDTRLANLDATITSRMATFSLPPHFASLSIEEAEGSVTTGIMTTGALHQFFTDDTGGTYSTAANGSVVKEIADNAGGASPTLAEILAGIIMDHGDGSYQRNTEPPTAAEVATAVEAGQVGIDAAGIVSTLGTPAVTIADAIADIFAVADQFVFTVPNQVDANALTGGGGGGGGSGAYPITMTFIDSLAAAIPGLVVRVHQGITDNVLTTNGSGVVTFNLDSGTWTFATTKSGYSTLSGSGTVTGSQAGTLVATRTVSASATSGSTDPARCTVTGTFKYGNGTPGAGVIIEATLVTQGSTGATGGEGVILDRVDITLDNTGSIPAATDLLRTDQTTNSTARWQFVCSAMKLNKKGVHLDGSSFLLTTLL